MADEAIPLGNIPVYGLLPEADVRKILDASFQLLREIGVAFDPDPRVLDRFSDAGCDISANHTVRFETDLVRECLETTAKRAKIWNRDGSDYLELRDGITSFMPGMTCIQVFDLETGALRASTREDIATITRVADALPEIDGVCLMVKDVPDSTLHGEIGEFVAMAENTSKPLEYLCQYSAALDAVIEMAAAIRGGMDRLEQKPYFMHIITPLPLYYAQTHIDQIIRTAECGIPVHMGTISIGGASAPYTIAGCVTHSLATDFAGMVLSQLVRKGSYCIGCSGNSFLEPLRGNTGNAVPGLLANLAMRQALDHFGLPPLLGGGGAGSGARRFNQDAALEIGAGMASMFYTRPTLVDYLGILDGGMTFSLHALLLCHDLAGMLRCLWNGVAVDGEHLALDLTRSVGPKGNYLAQPHTAKHCQENHWNSRYFGAKFPRSNSPAIPDRELFERIDGDLRGVLATPRPEPLPEPVRKEIRAILGRFEGA
jgi:trimethylamine:corrinoid methyltransferase-like protein